LKIVIAPDSFKGSLSATAAAEAAGRGVLRARPDAQTVIVPLADGGEGTVEALVRATGGRILPAVATDPLGKRIESFFGVLGDGETAVVEMAAAGPYMKQILDTYIGAANRENVYLGCYMAGNPYFKAADYIKAFGLFDKAHAAETDPSIRERIKTQRRSLELSLYLNSSAVEDQVVASGLIAHVDIDKWSRDYYDWATSTHNDYFKEGGKLTFSKFMSLGLASMNTPKSEKTPRACAGLADDDWVELQEDIATLFSAGNLIIKEEDLLASDGKTVRMPGNHYEWVFQMPMGAVVRKGITRGEVFVSVRVKSTGKGKGFSFGLYDTGTAKAAGAKAISASDTGADEYKEYSLGVCDITNSMYLWVAPPKSPEVDSVYVDRVFVIKKD
jgi:hypothetical protein